MNEVLYSVEWSKPILKILSQTDQLDPSLPAILHIRHTERPMHHAHLGTEQGFSALSTEQGKQATYELGTLLPQDRKYRLYHTRVERTRETAEALQKGLESIEAEAKINGTIPLSIVVNREKFHETSRREAELGLTLQDIGTRWLSGGYPESIRVPSIEFSKKAASFMIENLKDADDSCFDVYVSHEVHVAAFMFHWFGIYPVDWVEFLEGFMLQLLDDRMIIYTKDGKKERHYPHWWTP